VNGKTITPEDLRKIRTYDLYSRKSLASRQDFGIPSRPDTSLTQFLSQLPKTYIAKDLLRVASQINQCRKDKKVLHFSMGSHVLKNGLNPYLIDLMKRGYVTTLSFNGSALIHDFEIALVGATSEDVDASIGTGQFGVARQTAEQLNEATVRGVDKGLGLGRAVGEWILENTPHPEDSLLAQAIEYGVDATVHVAVGTDIIHIHPNFDAAKAAKGSYRDFLTFASSVANLEGGMYFNVGSAVILPEIFLKAVSLVRNLGHIVENFWAVNLDFMRHYRPRRNVLERPTQKGGQAVEIVGPHELIIPLLHGAVITRERQNID